MTRRVNDWELENPFSDLVRVLKANPQIRSRDDVNDVLRNLVDGIKDAEHHANMAIERQAMHDAELMREQAQKRLKELEGAHDILPF